MAASKPFVAIGITTYHDIYAADYGEAVYRAYRAHLPSLLPTTAKIWGKKSAVENDVDFARFWRTEAPYKKVGNRGRGPVLSRGTFQIGAEWSRPGLGGGEVSFRPEDDHARENTITFRHPFRERGDWLAFFRALVDIFNPSYAMMHLFVEDEIRRESDWIGDIFDGPVIGEATFASEALATGIRCRPDSFDHGKRRNYRHLPELAWANHFGQEFTDAFAPDKVGEEFAQWEKMADGYLGLVTPRLMDIKTDRVTFLERRRQTRRAFPGGFFWLSSRQSTCEGNPPPRPRERSGG